MAESFNTSIWRDDRRQSNVKGSAGKSGAQADAPSSSTMHGAAIVALHSTPLSRIRLVQHASCQHKKGAKHGLVSQTDIGG